VARLISQVVCLHLAVPALASEIVSLDRRVPAIRVSGRIELGDEKAFIDLVRMMPKARIVLAGPGGNVVAALAIGQEVRARNPQTLVPAGASCASACALIWLGGTTRMLGADARIGLHALATLRHGGVFGLIAFAMLMVMLSIDIFGPRTRDTELEQISH